VLRSACWDRGVDPGSNAPAVPVPGAPGLPRRVERDRPRHRVETEHPLRQASDRNRADVRNRASVPGHVSLRVDEHRFAGGIGRIRRDVQLAREGVCGVLPRAQPRAAHVQRGAVLHLARPHPPADAATRFNHYRSHSRLGEAARRRKAGVPGSDDANVGVDPIHQVGSNAPSGAILPSSGRSRGWKGWRRPEATGRGRGLETRACGRSVGGGRRGVRGAQGERAMWRARGAAGARCELAGEVRGGRAVGSRGQAAVRSDSPTRTMSSMRNRISSSSRR
jgi:hypothetical protein